MSEELLYTSSPEGLDPGTSGYCTVARTPGIAKPLQQALEALSRYEPLYLPGDPLEDNNPVNYRHREILVAGQRWHVLSRVAYSGRDYTGRNNQLAHHVVLSAQEIAQYPEGPGWLMHQRNFFREDWNGRIELLTPRPRLSSATGPSGWNCRKWEETMGDSGWAGWLVELTSDETRRPCGLLVDPSVNTLRLMSEALELLPAAQRWNISFCTYAIDLQSGCQWNGFIRDTRVADSAQSSFDDRLIDLNPGLSLPDEAASSAWVRFAQTGERPAVRSISREISAIAKPTPPPPRPPQLPVRLRPAPVAAVPAPPPPSPRRLVGQTESTLMPSIEVQHRGIGRALIWIGVGVAATLCLMFCAVLIFVNTYYKNQDDVGHAIRALPVDHDNKRNETVPKEYTQVDITKKTNPENSKRNDNDIVAAQEPKKEDKIAPIKSSKSDRHGIYFVLDEMTAKRFRMYYLTKRLWFVQPKSRIGEQGFTVESGREHGDNYELDLKWNLNNVGTLRFAKNSPHGAASDKWGMKSHVWIEWDSDCGDVPKQWAKWCQLQCVGEDGLLVVFQLGLPDAVIKGKPNAREFEVRVPFAPDFVIVGDTDEDAEPFELRDRSELNRIDESDDEPARPYFAMIDKKLLNIPKTVSIQIDSCQSHWLNNDLNPEILSDSKKIPVSLRVAVQVKQSKDEKPKDDNPGNESQGNEKTLNSTHNDDKRR